MSKPDTNGTSTQEEQDGAPWTCPSCGRELGRTHDKYLTRPAGDVLWGSAFIPCGCGSGRIFYGARRAGPPSFVVRMQARRARIDAL